MERGLRCVVLALLCGAAAVEALDPDACAVPRWPGVQASWHHGGASEKCFCAYAQGAPIDDDLCPTWKTYVSTDNETANKLSRSGTALVQGNASVGSASKYGSMTDWAVDLGSGYGEDCDPSLSPGCAAVGTHLLSIPRARFYLDCCTHPTLSLAAALRAGEGAAVCATLREMVGGALAQIQPDELASYDSCRAEDEEPALPGRCLAQCFHIVPDVYMAHLHTTAAAARQRNGPVNSGLGPQFNASQAADAPLHGRYNACACEPSSWADVTPGRGHCPAERPADAGYPAAAAQSLCKNIAGIAGLPAESCDACDGGNNSRMSVELR